MIVSVSLRQSASRSISREENVLRRLRERELLMRAILAPVFDRKIKNAPRRGAFRDEKTAGQMLKDEPQPQVVFAFGLRITNCAPCRLSL